MEKICNTLEDIRKMITDCERRKASAFSFVYNPGIHSYISQSAVIFRQWGVAGWRSSDYEGQNRIEYTQVTYMPHFRYCPSVVELEQHIKQMVHDRQSTFSFCCPAFTGLNKDLESVFCLYGITRFRYTTYENKSAFTISDIEYMPAFKKLSSLQEIKEYFETCASQLMTEFSFSYPKGISEELITSLGSSCGFWSSTYQFKLTGNAVVIRDIDYLTGFVIVHRLGSNTISQLTSEQKQTYNTAVGILSAAKKCCHSSLQYEKYFHDYLCSTVTYELKEGKNANDTAFGALCNKRAECDGYSDAFYLLCNMAGIYAGYQYCETSDGNNSQHLFNTVKINGKWYFTDVTWDDIDHADPMLYSCRYMNIGMDDIPHHILPGAMLKPVESHTDWDIYPYTAAKNPDICIGIYTRDPGRYFISKVNSKEKYIHFMTDGSLSAVEVNHILQKTPGLNASWTLSAHTIGRFTIADIRVTS